MQTRKAVDADPRPLLGGEESEQRQALRAEGRDIRIISQLEFKEIIDKFINN